jgi:hypothetical protein
MSKYISVDLGDRLRPLITEVLPYELPIWYSSYAFYQRMVDDGDFYKSVLGFDHKKNGDFIPLSFSVSRGDSRYRELSLMHPISQILVADFYQDFGDLFLYYCGISNKSLRAPCKISSSFYGKWSGSDGEIFGVELEKVERKTASSFFRYNKFSFLYGFYESYDYHRLEKKFSYLTQLDISRCFSSLYTHSISWAIKGKALAKLKSNGGFDEKLDSLVKNMNHQETNGILIGPEFSRLVAEIILQRIDVDFISLVENKYGYIVGRDYDFRRYVDDYFIFTRDQVVKKRLVLLLEECLGFYKLHLNESKKIEQKRPFSTRVSRGKSALQEILIEIYKSRYKDDGTLSKISRPDRSANNNISKIKRVCSDYELDYKSVSGYLLGLMTKKINYFLNRNSGVDQGGVSDWILVDLDMLYFFYSMDMRVVTTDKLAKLCLKIVDYSSSMSRSQSSLVLKKMYDLNRLALETVVLEIDGESTGVEAINLLFIHSLLPSSYKLKEEFLIEYYNMVSSHKNMTYMIWVSFVLYCRNEAAYSKLREVLQDKALTYFEKSDLNSSDTEFVIFILDYLACPFVDLESRKNIAKKLKEKGCELKIFASQGTTKLLKNDFISPWRDSDFMRNALKKRAFVFPY